MKLLFKIILWISFFLVNIYFSFNSASLSSCVVELPNCNDLVSNFYYFLIFNFIFLISFVVLVRNMKSKITSLTIIIITIVILLCLTPIIPVTSIPLKAKYQI
jgi:hypothetical protein